MNFSHDEKLDVLESYFTCDKSASLAIADYARRFPDRRTPSRTFVLKIIKSLTTQGSFVKFNRGRARAISEEDEIHILAYVNAHPESSIRQIASLLSLSYYKVQNVLKRHNYHDFHIRPVQTLHVGDEHHRMVFCQWLLDNNNFLSKIIWTDEACFSNKGMFNRKNTHYWSQHNPLQFVEANPQRRFSVNCWCALMGSKVLGFRFFEGNLTGARYLELLRESLVECLEDIEFETRQNIYFQHDGAPPHNLGQVGNLLEEYFPNRWISNNGPIRWPARSPDLTPMDFFLWGRVKDQVYKKSYASVDELTVEVTNVLRSLTRNEVVRATRSVGKRARVCLQQNGFQFEHLL